MPLFEINLSPCFFIKKRLAKKLFRFCILTVSGQIAYSAPFYGNKIVNFTKPKSAFRLDFNHKPNNNNCTKKGPISCFYLKYNG